MSRHAIFLGIAWFLLSLGVVEVEAKKKGGVEPVEIACSGKGGKTYVGKLFSIQTGAREITFKAGNNSKEFRIAGNCKMSTTEKSGAELTDLRLGEEYRVTYTTTKQDTEVACVIAPVTKKPAK